MIRFIRILLLVLIVTGVGLLLSTNLWVPGVVNFILIHESSLATSGSDPFHGIAVPSDPGNAADTTVIGVDSNGNGVRDEVERQIAKTYGANPNEYAGAMRVAKATQAFLIDNGDASSTEATQLAFIAGGCMFEKFSHDASAATKANNYIFALTINTPARAAAYQATSRASTEVSSAVPTEPCQ